MAGSLGGDLHRQEKEKVELSSPGASCALKQYLCIMRMSEQKLQANLFPTEDSAMGLRVVLTVYCGVSNFENL